MEAQFLLQTSNNISIASEQLQEYLKTVLVEEHFNKKTILLKEGQVSQRIYFMNAGFVRSFYDKAGNQYTNWFMGEGEIISSVYSFFSRQPSFENIEILDDSILRSINWDQLQNIYTPLS